MNNLPSASTVSLSSRQAEILRLIAEGLSNEEICATLYLSRNTVKTHIRTLYARIGVERRAQAVVWAYRHGVVAVGPTVTDD